VASFPGLLDVRRLSDLRAKRDALVTDEQQLSGIVGRRICRRVRKQVSVVSKLVADGLCGRLCLIEREYAATRAFGKLLDNAGRLRLVAAICTACAIGDLQGVDRDVLVLKFVENTVKTHLAAAIQAGADALLAASILHDGVTTVMKLKAGVADAGIPVRQ